MKNIFLKSIILIYLIINVSCNAELNVSPEDELTLEVVFSSDFAARGAVVGMYGQAREVNMHNGNAFILQGVISDELEWTGSFPTIVQLFDYSTVSTNTSTASFWREAYQMVNQANFIIKKVPLTSDNIISSENKDSYIGQAKFMRALAYFQLVNLYAQPYQASSGSNLGVPIITEPFDDNAKVEDFQKPRNTLNEVHSFINQDLEDAINLLVTSADNTIATKGAAQALKARLHLYREEWTEAVQMANTVIDSGVYAFSSNYDFWDTSNAEHIFNIVNTSTDGAFGGTGHSFVIPAPSGRGDAFLSDYLLNAFSLEPDDRRLIDNSTEGNNTLGVNKTFSTKIRTQLGDSDVSIIRITEMYYIRAEANLQAGSNIGDSPLNDINKMRNRAGLPPLSSLDIDIILNERWKEFFLEGHRRMDLLRNRKNLRPASDPQADKAIFGAPKTIFPIPPREIENNTSLNGQQNAGY